jgi:hypothetical protein
MLTFITFGLISLLTGMVLGQRFKILVLVPAFAISLPAVIGIGMSHYGEPGPALLLAALAVAGLQMGYLIGGAIRYALAAERASEVRSASLHDSAPARRIAQ